MDQTTPSKHWLGFIASLFAIVTLGAVFRVYHLGYRSFYFDEAYQYFASLDPLHLIRDDGHPPLSHYIEHFIVHLGRDEATLRMIPVLFGIGTIVVTYQLGKALFDKRIGLISALFVAISPILIYYSQEARPYSQFVFFSIASFLLLLSMVKKPSIQQSLVYILATVFCLYSHIFAVFVLMAHNIYILLLWKKERFNLKPWIVIQLLILVCYIPAIMFILDAMGQRAPLPYSIINTTAGLFYVFSFGRLLFPADLNLIIVALGAIVFGGGILLGIKHLWQKNNRASLFFLAVAITVIFVLLVNYKFRIFNEEDSRYLLYLSPLFYILSVRGITSISNVPARLISIVLVLIISAASLHPYYFKWDTLGKGSFRQASEEIKNQALTNNDLILCSDYQIQRVIGYYLRNKSACELLPADQHLANRHPLPSKVVIAKLSDRTALDFIRNGPVSAKAKVDEPFNAHLLEQGYQLMNKQFWPGKNRIDLYTYLKN